MLLDSSFSSAALEYIRRIRNADKSRYARDYYRHIKFGMLFEFLHPAVSTMAKQSVEMAINDIVSKEDL